VSRSVEELARAALQRVHHITELAAAEVHLAALSGLTMLLCVMIAAAALVVAWGLLVACVLYLASRSFAYYLWQVTVRLSRNLTLPELRTTLRRNVEQPEADTHETVVLVDSGS